jgi:hypothetical protein
MNKQELLDYLKALSETTPGLQFDFEPIKWRGEPVGATLFRVQYRDKGASLPFSDDLPDEIVVDHILAGLKQMAIKPLTQRLEEKRANLTLVGWELCVWQPAVDNPVKYLEMSEHDRRPRYYVRPKNIPGNSMRVNLRETEEEALDDAPPA